MTEKFDPYYKWLGVPPRDQPPHHYRLLGIELFENDRDVIDAAANRVMAYLKELATGDEAEYSQDLLNEVSRARICLLNRNKKKAYDEELRADLKLKEIPKPKVAKPAAKPPAKRRKEATQEGASPPLPPSEKPWPGIRVEEPAPKSPVAETVFAESDESDDEEIAATSRSKLIAVVAAGIGGVLLAGLIVTLVFLFSSGDNRVASGHNGGVQNGLGGDPQSHSEQDRGTDIDTDPQTDPEASPKLDTDPETDINTDPQVEPDAPLKPETDPETDPAPISKANTKPPSEGETKPETEPDDSTSSDIASKLPDWAAKPEDPDDGSSTSDPSAGNVFAKPEDEPTPDDTTVAKVDLPDVDPPKKKPAVPKPSTKPKLQPFEDFPQVISLPGLEDADAMTEQVLGPIHCRPSDLCFIKLRGGKKAIKGDQAFLMRNADDGLAERDWEVFSRDDESEPETKIAHLSLNDQSQLTFQWQPEAKTLPLSAQLRNCVLSLSCGGQSRVATLREATQVEGMALELDKPATDGRWTLDSVPDPSAVKIEIVGVQGSEYTVQPAAVMEAHRGEAWIDLKEGGGVLSLKVETEMRRNVEMTVTPHLKMPPDGKPQRFNARAFAQALNQMKAQLAQSPFVIQTMKRAATQATGREKTQMDQRVAQLELAQAELQANVENAQKLDQLVKGTNGAVQVQFRVFYDADGSEVELMRIGE